MSLQDIETFVIVILENRSFDHMVGYLSLANANPPMPVDGLRDDPVWQANYGNDFGGASYNIMQLDPGHTVFDPPHTSTAISQQITTPPHLASLNKMGGFVASYANPTYYKAGDPQPPAADLPLVMGYYDKQSSYVFDFFARNFAICDKWFSSLPASTQPNRLMAMSGESTISDNVNTFTQFPNQDLVYDWLNRTPNPDDPSSKVSWCSYQWHGYPFFTLMSRWRGAILAQLADPIGLGNFRHYNDFYGIGQSFKVHWQNGDQIPSVVFIEPKYTDDQISSATPNDDHPPTGIPGGQALLLDIYNTLISNPALWAKTMMIVTYDEHGGFFDHVQPINIPAHAGDQLFSSTGVRVPAFVVSPHVEPGTVFQGPLDHTSILQLLADRFTPNKTYSQAVADRQAHLVRLSTILTPRPPAQARAPEIPAALVAAAAAEGTRLAAQRQLAPPPESTTETAQAFRELKPLVAARYPQLLRM